MGRLVLLALVLAGCEGSDLLVTHELPPTPPSPVAVAPGTLVVDTWQFRNACQRPRDIVVWREGELHPLGGNAGTAPNVVFDTAIHCAAGEMLCYGSTDKLGRVVPDAAGCDACAPGVRPAIVIGCE